MEKVLNFRFARFVEGELEFVVGRAGLGVRVPVDGDTGVTLGDDLRERGQLHYRHVWKSFGICQLSSKTPVNTGGGGGS